MKHARACGLVLISSALLGPAVASAGTTTMRPAIQVKPPVAVPAPTADEVPPPGPEVAEGVASVELPAIPDFEHAPPVPVAAPAAIARAKPALASERARNLSINALNICQAALDTRRYEAAVIACQSATAAWDGNHRAWYGWASAHTANSEWSRARTAIEHAVALRPDVAMYQMVHGIALYRTEWQRARAVRDRSADDLPVRLDAARAALVRAIAIAPGLWRAHYYLGCIERDRRDDRAAAEQFGAAIRANPSDRGAYIALAELYRARAHVDQALAVATLGTKYVPPANSASLWFEIAMAHDAHDAGAPAIAALDRAIALQPGDAVLRLERGRLYFQRADLDSARRDLEDVARATDPMMAAAARRAKQLLAELAEDGNLPDATYRICNAFRACYPVSVSNLSWMGDAWMSSAPGG